MPDGLLSGTGLAVVNGTFLCVPIVGTRLSMFHFGGEFPGADLVGRLCLFEVRAVESAGVFLIVTGLLFAVAAVARINPGSLYGTFWAAPWLCTT